MGKLPLKTVAGTKFIQASEEITKEQYCKIRGWEVPANEDPNELGRLVVYPNPEGKPSNLPGYDGYVSWSPKFAFDEVYRENGNLSFGHAIEAMKQGKRAARKGWNQKGMFVFIQIPSQISYEVVSKMQSLPQLVKDEFINRIYKASDSGALMMNVNDPLLSIKYQNHFGIVYPDNTISGWTASPSDILKNDWEILD